MTQSGELSVSDAQSLVGPGYTLRGLIRPCGFADEFSACDEALGREVTLTMLRVGPRCGEDCVGAIGALLRRHASLAHHAIVSPIAIERSGRSIFYVTRRPDGQNVEDLLHARTLLPVDRVLALVGAAAEALDHAHEHGVVHKTLVPSDITMDATGHACVANFGVQAALRQIADLGHGRAASLVRAYAAPEYWRGLDVDGRADQYSLAVIAYELIAGVRRLDAVDVGGIQTLDPIEISAFTALRPGLGLHVNAALRTALSASASNRFETTTDFSEALAGRRSGSLFTVSRAPRDDSGPRTLVAVASVLAGLAVAAGSVIAFPELQNAALGVLRPARLGGLPDLTRPRFPIGISSGDLAVGGSSPRHTIGGGGLSQPLPDVPAAPGRRADVGGGTGTSGSNVTAPTGTATGGGGKPSAAAPTAGTSASSPASPRRIGVPGTRLAASTTITPPTPDVPAAKGWARRALAELRAIAGRAGASVGLEGPSTQARAATTGRATRISLPVGRATGAPTAAPARAAATTASTADGTVSVAVRGGGAIVLIDGIPRGTAPLTARLDAGRHTISVKGAGRYTPATTVMTVGAGSSSSAVFTLAP